MPEKGLKILPLSKILKPKSLFLDTHMFHFICKTLKKNKGLMYYSTNKFEEKKTRNY